MHHFNPHKVAWYPLFAAIVMVFHTCLIFSIFSAIGLSWRFAVLRPIVSAALLSAVSIWSIFGGCPLTFIENYLRIKAGLPRPLLTDGFIPYYLHEWLGVHVTRSTITLGTMVITACFVSIALYWLSITIKKQNGCASPTRNFV